MTDYECLLKTISDNPDDDFCRLVVADWLEENGNGEHCELIRLQVEIANLVKTPELDPCRMDILKEREAEVSPHVYSENFIPHNVLWDRGFIVEVCGSSQFFLIGIPKSLDLHPVHTTSFSDWYVVETRGLIMTIIDMPRLFKFLKNLELPCSRFGFDYSRAEFRSEFMADGLIGTYADGSLEVVVDNNGNPTYLRDIRAYLPGIEG